MRLVFMICFQNRFRMQLKLWLRTVSVAQFVFLPTSRYCKYTPIFVPLQPILNIQTKMRLRYAYVSVLLLMSFSTIANVWASSSLSPDGRAFSYAVSSDTVRESRA